MKKIIMAVILMAAGGAVYAADCDCACKGGGHDMPPAMEGRGPEGMDADKKGGDAAIEERLAKISKEVGLSAEQEKKLSALRKAKKNSFEASRKEMKAAADAMKAAMEKDPLDEKALRAAHQKMTKLMDAAAEARFEEMLAMRKIVTAEQFAKMRKISGPMKGGFDMDKDRDGRRGGKGRMMRHGGDDMPPAPEPEGDDDGGKMPQPDDK